MSEDWEDWDDWDPDESPGSTDWECPACGVDNRSDRTDCRICMCPRENLCRKCKQPNQRIARFCRFCGGMTVYNVFKVFDPEEHKESVERARAMDRKYKKLGHYFEWEDGPFQGFEDHYD